MRTLEQAIIWYDGLAKDAGATGFKAAEENNRQLSAWLCELQDRRAEPEIVFCKDCRKHNVKVGFDENFHTVWKEDACPLVDWRGKAKEHEFDYQYCAFAERRTDD